MGIQSGSGETVAVPQRIIDIVTDSGIPFRVVYGKRVYRNGEIAKSPTVAFYDRRYDFDAHGQFVSEYNRETMLERRTGYGLELQGDVPNWYVDASAMYVICTWLNHMAYQEER